MPNPPTLPSWLTEQDLDVYAEAFERTGFRGALNRYRNLDRDWRELPSLGTQGPRCPLLFVGGERDPAVVYGDLTAMKALPSLRDVILLPGCGHWTQQERPAAVNDALLTFLTSVA